MLLGVVLLYVGAVLVINGIWLIGGARRAEVGPEPIAGGAVGAEAPPLRRDLEIEHHPATITDREVAVINIFTGFVGVFCAIILAAQGNQDGDLSSIRAAGFILLFAFTYLWVAFNQYLNPNGHAFGWYCLFVAATAVAAGAYTIDQAGGDDASIWLGIDWFAWAVLWAMFFALLALERPIARVAGVVAVLEGIATSWVFGFLLLEGTIVFD
ncbi:MAG TPA: AmiS/UreI family transporter [Capillimicrobium sp.]|nr:AmiS/UreI family transporter [Capillimicrobium sp.]